MANINKQIKFFYYIKSYMMRFLPASSYKGRIEKLEQKVTEAQLQNVSERVSYYCKLSEKPQVFSPKYTIRDLKNPVTPKTYYHDTYEYARFFPQSSAISFVFGDVTQVPPTPSIVKSRPVSGENENSVLLNLDKARHFVWIRKDRPFPGKKDMLIGRGAVFQQHRHEFYRKYFDHPLCDLGQSNTNGGNPEWTKKKISIEDHLEYKFILCLQGNDVATNLKWVMSSNSIAVMPKPTVETWFMEGKLEGGRHFIELQADYSDLDEQLNHYISHPEKCLRIIQNAHEHCEQFFNKNVEDLCSLRVLEKYFSLTSAVD